MSMLPSAIATVISMPATVPYRLNIPPSFVVDRLLIIS